MATGRIPDLRFARVLEPVKRRALDRSVTIAVTGLAQAGKTVFTTALAHNLRLAPRRGPELLPFFEPARTGRVTGVRLADARSRPFPFDAALACLTTPPPAWPPSTTDVSALSLEVEYRVEGALLKRVAATSRLTLNIVDYPGEWLLDFPLLQMSFAQWSEDTLALCRVPPRAALAKEWLDAVAATDANLPASGELLAKLAGLYRAFLHRCREGDAGIVLLQPGRFLVPGDVTDPELLHFCPFPASASGKPRTGSLAAELARRYEAYRRNVVERFYREHFRRFTRQIVLVDVLSAMAKGPQAVSETQLALRRIFDNFHAQRSRILQRMFGARTERLLFACSKADHITNGQYGNLRNLLRALVSPQAVQMHEAGAMIGYEIVAAVKATTNHTTAEGVRLIRGRPIGSAVEQDLDPGDIPETLPDAEHWPELQIGTFAPPPAGNARERGLPSVYLDRCLEFLIGDLFR